MPYARETLSALCEKGFRLGIVSNAQFYTPLLLEAFFNTAIADLGFEPGLCSWSYSLREAKPSVKMFENPLAVLAIIATYSNIQFNRQAALTVGLEADGVGGIIVEVEAVLVNKSCAFAGGACF